MNEIPEHQSYQTKWKSIAYAILISQSLTVGAFAVTTPILPYILEDLFNLKDKELLKWNGLMFIASSLSMAVFSPIWGSLADRIGKRLMLLRAVLGGMTVLLLMTFVQSPNQLLMLRILQGAFTGSIPAATVLLLSITPRLHTATTLALLQVAIYSGNSLGPLLGGILYDYLSRFDALYYTQLGGRVNFLFTAIILACSLLILLKWVPKEELDKNIKKNKNSYTDYSVFTNNPLLIILMLTTFIVSIAFSLINPIFPLFIKTILPIHDNLGKASGLIIGSASLAIAIGSLFFARLGKNFAMEKLLLVAIAGSAIFYLPKLYASNWQILLALRFIESFFIGGITPGLNYLISTNSSTKKHGAIFGIVASLNAIGMAVGPALGAYMMQDYDFFAIFYTGTALLLMLFILLFVFQFIKKNDRHHST